MDDIWLLFLIVICAIILIVSVFNTGKIISLSRHNKKQDNDISEIRGDIDDIENDMKAISSGQERMYSDFKQSFDSALQRGLQPVIEANNRQSERIDKILELMVNPKR